jgi:hypothetical protein
MYHPYLRGKQYELTTIRETAELLARMKFVPIVEPVQESLNGLERTLKAISNVQGKAVVIVNPHYGDHEEDGIEITELLRKSYHGGDLIGAGILLKQDMTVQNVVECCNLHRNHPLTLIHAGFTQPKALADALDDALITTRDVFLEAHCSKLYRKHFQGDDRILLRDGFKRRRSNSAYPPVEKFSDLHVTYMEEGMNGFGDFLIVGDEYAEGGGPAYAVAIHLTFIDPEQDGAMFIYHFVSNSNEAPTDTAGKFAEALSKMILKLDTGTSKLLETTAVKELRELHVKGHFPGLGYVKKLSMKHHIETLAAFLS